MSTEATALVQWEPPIEEPTGDLLVKSRLYNALLHDAIKKSGLTQAQYGKPLGIKPGTLSSLVGLRLSPWNFKTGERRDFAEALADYIQIPFNELFPRSLYILRTLVPPESLERRYESVELVPLLEARNVPTLESPSEIYSQKELREGLRKALIGLTPREELVLKLKFGLDGNACTTAEIAEQLNVCRARAYQIEARGLRKLRCPSHSKYLKPFLSVNLVKRENSRPSGSPRKAAELSISPERVPEVVPRQGEAEPTAAQTARRQPRRPAPILEERGLAPAPGLRRLQPVA